MKVVVNYFFLSKAAAAAFKPEVAEEGGCD